MLPISDLTRHQEPKTVREIKSVVIIHLGNFLLLFKLNLLINSLFCGVVSERERESSSHNCELVSIIISIKATTTAQKNLNYQARHGQKIRELTGLKMIKIQSQSSIFLWYCCATYILYKV